MSKFAVWRCTGCGEAHWPQPELCVACAERGFERVPVVGGRARHLTTHLDTSIVEVVLDDSGVVVLARGDGVTEGMPVELTLDGGVAVARPA